MWRGRVTEPSYEALDRLVLLLHQKGCELYADGIRYVDGTPWVMCSPELMLKLIEAADGSGSGKDQGTD